MERGLHEVPELARLLDKVSEPQWLMARYEWHAGAQSRLLRYAAPGLLLRHLKPPLGKARSRYKQKQRLLGPKSLVSQVDAWVDRVSHREVAALEHDFHQETLNLHCLLVGLPPAPNSTDIMQLAERREYLEAVCAVFARQNKFVPPQALQRLDEEAGERLTGAACGGGRHSTLLVSVMHLFKDAWWGLLAGPLPDTEERIKL